MKAYEDDYIIALSKVHEDTESFKMVESLIKTHFAMVEHMKKTSLYDVLMYEKRFVENSIEPMKIVTNDNEKLKKEVNDLRKQLGLRRKEQGMWTQYCYNIDYLNGWLYGQFRP